MKEELSVLERLLLLVIVPATGSITQIGILNSLREMLSFNEEENERLKFITDEATGSTRWNEEAGKQFEAMPFEINRVQRKIIDKAMRNALEKMNNEDALSQAHLDLGRRFVADYDDLAAKLIEAATRKEEAVEKAETDAAEAKAKAENEDNDSEGKDTDANVVH